MPPDPINPHTPPLPVVLVGGSSQRFGRDKLLEPLGGEGEILVDRPIRALRRALGVPVAVVGACDPVVVARADLVIPDPYPGTGPIGGVLAALEHANRDVFVLAGDLPAVTPETVRTILDAAAEHPDAWAVVARTDTMHPTIGIYRPACTAHLRHLVSEDRLALGRAIPDPHRLEVTISSRDAVNVNRAGDL